MPTFPATGPIRVALDIAVGDITIVASARTDASVDIRPRSGARPGDLRAVEATLVEFRGDTLTIRGPKSRLSSLFGFGRGDAVDVTLAIPEGSRAEVETTYGNIRADGRLGDARLRTGYGFVRLDEAADLVAESGYGDVTADRTTGRLDLVTGGGAVRIGTIAGAATIKNSDGPTELGTAGPDLRVKAAHGDIVVGRVDGTVSAKTAYGGIRIDEVARGALQLETAYGQIEVGIRAGTAAWLDAHTGYGRVRNQLTPDGGGGEPAATAEIRARTAYGDILLRRVNRAP